MDITDRKLLNLLQKSCPLVEEPFDDLGVSLGIGSTNVVDRIRCLKDANVIRQISAIFDTRRLGFHTALVAMHFPFV